MKQIKKIAVCLFLIAALLVGILPTSVMAVHSEAPSVWEDQTSLLAQTARIYLNNIGEKDETLPRASDLTKYGSNYPDQHVNIIPITPEQVEQGDTVQFYSNAEIVMSALVADNLIEKTWPLDISKTKFMVFMAVSDSISVDMTTDFLFNSTFLMPDEAAMKEWGANVTVSRDMTYLSSFVSDNSVDMRWKISGDLEDLRIVNQNSQKSQAATTAGVFDFEAYLAEIGYLDDKVLPGSGTLSDCLNSSWAYFAEDGSGRNYNVNIYAIPVKMNWSVLVDAVNSGSYQFADGYVYADGDESKAVGKHIYDRFTREDFMCPMYLTAAQSEPTQYDGIKMAINLDDVNLGYMGEAGYVEWMREGVIDNYIPTEYDNTNGYGWYYSVDAMPVSGLIVGNIYRFEQGFDDTISELYNYSNYAIKAGTILNQFAYATPGTIHVTKTIEGLKRDAVMPDRLDVTIVDQNGNPARDLQGNVVTAAIEKKDWTYEDGTWTAAIDVTGLRPSDETYGWDYQYTVTVEGETPFSGYKQEQEPQYTTDHEDLVLENQYTLGRGEAGKITYDANPETPAVTVNVTSRYSTTDVTLTYNANGGSGDDVVKTYPLNNNTVTLLDNSATNFTRAGYTFTGWADAAGRTYKPGETLTLTANLTLYAQWSRDVAWDGRPVDKTATDLDRDYQSNVTLTLPAEGYQKEVDVVFAIDCSSVLENNADEMAQALTQMAEELIAKDNVLLNVGVVGYGHNADVLAELQGVNADTVDVFMENLEEAFLDSLTDDSQIDHDGGSNVQVGIRTARELLVNSATGALPENRHLVLMTDGAGFYYCRSETDDTSVCTVYGNMCIGNMDANADIGGPERMYDSMYMRLTKEGKTFADFITEQGAAIEASAVNSFSQEEAAEGVDSSKTYTIDQIKSFTEYPYLNMERGTYFAAQELLKAKNAGYKVITIGYTYKHADALPSLGAVSSGFLAWTGTIGEYYDGNADIDTILGSISNTLGQFVDAGSRVIDEIGAGRDSEGNRYDFAFVNDAESLSLTVGGVKLTTTKVNTNSYSFGTEDQPNQFVLTYYKNGVTLDGTTYGECFVWEINVPVTVDAPVELTYSVELTNPQKAPGTYENLHTNNSAILYPVDSDGRPVTPVEFPDPTVSYKVSWPIIIPEVPDDTIPNWLNLDDHYAYIIGYDDGFVKPENNITRAEVATIFFRLLTDEAREYFWSTDSGFSDVKSSDWYNNAVSTMVNAGIITGYNDGTFRPNDPITRAEFATIAARFLSDPYSLQDRFYDTEGHWAEVYINRAAEVGWINGYNDGSFRPDKAITRAEAMTLVNAVLGREPHKDHLLPNMIIWPDNPKTAWYYEEIQEATNSHDYDWASSGAYEIWTALLENRQWAKLEKEWSNAYSAPGGEVMQ